MYNDEFAGQGGSYILDPTTGKRTRVQEPTAENPRSVPNVIDLTSLVARPAAEIIAALLGLSVDQLAQLAALEAAGKARVTVLDAITAEQAKR